MISVSASPAKLDKVRNHTCEDIILSHLKDVIHQGWPKYPDECPPDLKKFWNYSKELSVEWPYPERESPFDPE